MWLALPMIVILLIGAGLLMIIAVYKIIDIIVLLATSGRRLIDIETHYVSAQIISIIDIFVLIIGMFIFSSSVYRLFIGPLKQSSALKIDSLDGLKSSIAKVILLFLITFLAQEIVNWVDPLNTLYFSISITLACGVLIWFITSLKKK